MSKEFEILEKEYHSFNTTSVCADNEQGHGLALYAIAQELILIRKQLEYIANASGH